MITKEQFLKVIDAEIQGSKCVDKLCEMHIDIVESPLFNSWGIILDEFFDSHFTEEETDAQRGEVTGPGSFSWDWESMALN